MDNDNDIRRRMIDMVKEDLTVNNAKQPQPSSPKDGQWHKEFVAKWRRFCDSANRNLTKAKNYALTPAMTYRFFELGNDNDLECRRLKSAASSMLEQDFKLVEGFGWFNENFTENELNIINLEWCNRMSKTKESIRDVVKSKNWYSNKDDLIFELLRQSKLEVNPNKIVIARGYDFVKIKKSNKFPNGKGLGEYLKRMGEPELSKVLSTYIINNCSTYNEDQDTTSEAMWKAWQEGERNGEGQAQYDLDYERSVLDSKNKANFYRGNNYSGDIRKAYQMGYKAKYTEIAEKGEPAKVDRQFSTYFVAYVKIAVMCKDRATGRMVEDDFYFAYHLDNWPSSRFFDLQIASASMISKWKQFNARLVELYGNGKVNAEGHGAISQIKLIDKMIKRKLGLSDV